ncbi:MULTISPECIES: NADP-dependent oxidoreductase [unclassified Kitasatospora]|uniref:NADP-dependent oxidoreductase n=1 Tax=unclassified Kitasatospora TaxID=2633591 RepID=UPI0033F40D9C
MRAAYIEAFGAIEDVVRVGVRPDPAIGANDVLIRVRSASVNPIDHIVASGALQTVHPVALPLTLGNDAAGVVVGKGEAVTRFKVGDEVYTRVDPATSGAFADYVAVDQGLVALKPETIGFDAAASLPLVALTAWQGLVEHASLSEGQKVLIHAGSGGVGSIAIQLARHLGAHITTTVSADGVAQACEHGAHQVVDYRTEKFEDVDGDFDVVLDTLGGEVQERSYGVLKPGGVLVSTVWVPAAHEAAERHGIRVEPFFMRPSGEQLETLARLVDAGTVRPFIDRAYGLDETADALRHSASKRAKGKIVIRVS